MTLNQAKAKTETLKRVMLDKKEICNYGALRYKEYGVDRTDKPAVTDDFLGALLALPVHYNHTHYFDFIESWGTVSFKPIQLYCTLL